MKCLRCQHENAPRIKFCGECGTPLTANPSGPPAPSYAEVTRALSEALEQRLRLERDQGRVGGIGGRRHWKHDFAMTFTRTG
jgi:hypothetical protein